MRYQEAYIEVVGNFYVSPLFFFYVFVFQLSSGM